MNHMKNSEEPSLEERIKSEPLRVGLIAAGGTGAQVVDILRTVLDTIGDQHGLQIEYSEFGYAPKTFWELKDSPEEKAAIEERESADLVTFCREAYQDGFHTIFQSATNAGTLYQQRRETDMMKLMEIPVPNGTILVAREQGQGFYTIEKKVEGKVGGDERITFTSSYSKEKLYQTLDAAIEEARARFGDDFSTRFVYKYHLFDAFDGWVEEYMQTRGLEEVDVAVVQPDTGYDWLMRRHPHKEGERSGSANTLAIVSNEIGDILTEALPNHYDVGDKATMFATNVSLEPRTQGQVVYQTIHGSADDIAGTGKLNPFATIRAAADILERRAGLKGTAARFEKAIKAAEKSGHVTPDLGGAYTTDKVVDSVLDAVQEQYARGEQR